MQLNRVALLIQRPKRFCELSPDGVMLTNGPGDPKDVPEAIEMIQAIKEKFRFSASA